MFYYGFDFSRIDEGKLTATTYERGLPEDERHDFTCDARSDDDALTQALNALDLEPEERMGLRVEFVESEQDSHRNNN